MKILLTLVISIFCFFGCKNEKHTETNTKEKNEIINIDDFKKHELKIDTISSILKSVFEITNLDFSDAHNRTKQNFYSVLDSTQIKSFNSFPEFLVIEFVNAKSASNEFGKIKSIAQKSIADKKELHNYYNVFHKSGISYNLIDKWIIGHMLACNMYPKDYEIDKQVTSELEKLDSEVDWIRSFCGWSKMEVKQ